jgi:hypothetical protein
VKATSFRIRDEGAVSAVWVAGRLGAGEDRELRGVARSLRLAGVRLLVLDLQDVREIDLHGLVAVLEIEAETRERAGWELAVVPPSIQVEPQFRWNPSSGRPICDRTSRWWRVRTLDRSSTATQRGWTRLSHPTPSNAGTE